MLAEHNRTGPALAAHTATFPLNDVDLRRPARSQSDPRRWQTRVFSGCLEGPPRHAALDPTGEDKNGGAGRDRTDDLMLAKQLLSQLSYSPNL